MKILLIANSPMTLEKIQQRIKDNTNYKADIVHNAPSLLGSKDGVVIEIEEQYEILKITALFNEDEKRCQVGITQLLN